MTYKEQERFAEDLLERGASLEEWLKALEDYPYSPYTWLRAAKDSRTPPEVLVRLLAHPWHLVPEEAAKTWRGTRRPRTNTSRPWWTRCSLQKKPFTSSLKDTLAATLRQRAGDKNPEWFKEVLLYDLSKL